MEPTGTDAVEPTPTGESSGPADEPDDSAPQGARLVGSDRVLAVLTQLATHPDGVSLDQLSRAVASPKSTVHRALASLRRAGFARQDVRGRYLLGDELLRMAFAHHEARPEHQRVVPVLEELARRFGETAHYAVLDGRSVVYRSKVDPPVGAIKLASTVGGRQPAHSTAVGKVLLAAELTDASSVRAWVADESLARFTDRTITTATRLHVELEQIRGQGYAVDDQENETGINCIALGVHLTSPTRPSGAISISALVYRRPLQALVDDLPTIRTIISA